MVDYTGVKLDGARQLRSTLRKAGVDMKQLRDTNKQVAGVVVTAAGSRVPTRTGRLAATMRPGATQTAAIARAGNNRSGGVPYGNPIHWGWFKRHIRPNPFLSLAAQATEPTWFNIYSERIGKILDTIKGK